jgi:hypothetical protein
MEESLQTLGVLHRAHGVILSALGPAVDGCEIAVRSKGCLLPQTGGLGLPVFAHQSAARTALREYMPGE